MGLFNEGYELSSSTEIDMLLIDLPMDLIKENLRSQIQDPLATGVNYMESVIDKINEMKDVYEDNPESLSSVNIFAVEFFSFVIGTIAERFDLSLDIDYNDTSIVEDYALNLYMYFICAYKRNVTLYLRNYIQNNRKGLAEEFDHYAKKKDVTTNTTKKKTKNRDEVLIISNLPIIINYIMKLEIEPVDFIEYSESAHYFDASFVGDLYNSGLVSGNFVPVYLNHIREEHEEVLDDIQSEVKIQLLKK